jgi:hypothetical protein
MLRKYPTTIKWRQALPPLFALSLFCLGILSLISSVARWLLMIEISLYLLVLLGAGVLSSIKHREIGYALGIPLSIATMHISWGTAFIWGMLIPFKTDKLHFQKK